MAVRIRMCAAMLGVAALAACSSGGGGGSSSDGPTSGIANPEDITGASPEYISSLTSQLAIVNSGIVRAGLTDVPLSGTATYSGFGSIYDASVTDADDTAARLRGRSVVSDVVGTATFGGNNPTVNITQRNFRDVDGVLVPGTVTWTTKYEGDGAFRATVSGSVGGTEFATEPDQAIAGFYAEGNDTAILGQFRNAAVSVPGTLQGTSISGDIAATGTITP